MAAASCVLVAAVFTRLLDPCTRVRQTDEFAEGVYLSSTPGYWPVPCGLDNPLSPAPRPRIIHCSFDVAATPYPEYDPDKPSALFKTSQTGYLPSAPKYAYIGGWLGPLYGPWKPRVPMEAWELVDCATGETVFRGEGIAAPRLRVLDKKTKEGVPVTGEETYEMDFSHVTKEGRYFIRIPGVGRSDDFAISATAAEDAFRVHMSGLYHKRCGIDKAEPWTHWTSGACHQETVRGTFPPDEGTLSPKSKWFDIIRDNTDWNGAEKIHAPGGWHDAADYDRRPMHLNIVNDLCAVYLMRPGNFRDGQLAIPENANGIPDILDEAEWGLRHILAAQQSDGGTGTWFESTGHPGPGNIASRDPMPYAVSRATRKSSAMYAAHAALLARCHEKFREKYLDSAIRAWNFAATAEPQTVKYVVRFKSGRMIKTDDSISVVWKEDPGLPAPYLVKAAVNLAALTGDSRYLDFLLPHLKEFKKETGSKGWSLPPLLFSGEQALGVPDVLEDFMSEWNRRVKRNADTILKQMETSMAYRAPWWAPGEGWFNSMGFGACHPLRRAQYLVAAHGATGDKRYEDAASLANDFHNGCNPAGTTLTSGLGKTYPVAFLDLPSYVDGIAEYVPGITPYRWTGGMPAKAVEKVWNGDRRKASRWPIWRRWGNLENQTVGASEYTVWETIGPAASVTGYLSSPSSTAPVPRPAPADDIGKLPGYWLLP